MQADKYASGLPAGLDPPVRPLPFLYLSTGAETMFTNLLDPDPRSRRVFQIHQPGTLGASTKVVLRRPAPAFSRPSRRAGPPRACRS